MRNLQTTAEVILALGGIKAVASLTHRSYDAVQHWQKFKNFPPDTFLVLRSALAEREYHAPVSLWRMVPP